MYFTFQFMIFNLRMWDSINGVKVVKIPGRHDMVDHPSYMRVWRRRRAENLARRTGGHGGKSKGMLFVGAGQTFLPAGWGAHPW